MIKNPLKEKLRHHNIILSSGSPRRKKFFEDLGINFEIRLKPIQEIYPNNLVGAEISAYLAELKALALEDSLEGNDILITSDTVVWHNQESLAKARDSQEAIEMLQKLSDKWHEVITSVCFTTSENRKTVSASTKVKFAKMTHDEINFYVNQYKPFDKAGAYGIQEWIGAIAIEKIEGSYNNVVGLPTQLVYKTLMSMVG